MPVLPPQGMILAEFLEWAESQDDGRYELHDGQVIAMTPECAAHARAKLTVTMALCDAIERADAACEAFVSGLAVAIDEKTAYLPDALINGGPRASDDQMVVPEPIVIVEVLSPSTKAFDQSNKLLGYFRVPSIEHYVIVDLENRAVIHHKRTGENLLQTAMLRMGLLRFDPPGIEVTVADLFGDDAS